MPGRAERRRWWPFRSLASKLIALFVILVSVPVIIYAQFLDADREKQKLLLQSVQEQGRLTGQALLPILAGSDDTLPLEKLKRELARLAGEDAAVKVLFRPLTGAGEQGFYYVAAHPVVPTTQLDRERERLTQQGVLDRLSESCSGGEQLAIRYQTPAGDEEIITSITPVNTVEGCWAVITTHSTAAFLGESVGKPYWQRPEIRLAAAIYLAMVAISLTIFISVWRSINRFGRLARAIRQSEETRLRFADLNRVPELSGVAEDFDRLVEALRESARNIRRAAEENAHALKTPIAIIRQSLEPLKRALGEDGEREGRAIDRIEKSVDRLDAIVSTARRMDEAAADLVDPPRVRVDLSDLVRHIVAGYGELLESRGMHLSLHVTPGIDVLAGADLLETVIENVLDNDISLSPPGSTIGVRLTRIDGHAELVIEDEGPGVPPANLERIFERYYSDRPKAEPPVADEDETDPHFGIGLWIVRRNVAAVGGSISAENRPNGGLRIRIVLPCLG